MRHVVLVQTERVGHPFVAEPAILVCIFTMLTSILDITEVVAAHRALVDVAVADVLPQRVRGGKVALAVFAVRHIDVEGRRVSKRGVMSRCGVKGAAQNDGKRERLNAPGNRDRLNKWRTTRLNQRPSAGSAHPSATLPPRAPKLPSKPLNYYYGPISFV